MQAAYQLMAEDPSTPHRHKRKIATETDAQKGACLSCPLTWLCIFSGAHKRPLFTDAHLQKKQTKPFPASSLPNCSAWTLLRLHQHPVLTPQTQTPTLHPVLPHPYTAAAVRPQHGIRHSADSRHRARPQKRTCFPTKAHPGQGVHQARVAELRTAGTHAQIALAVAAAVGVPVQAAAAVDCLVE